MFKKFIISVFFVFSAGNAFADTYQIYMPSTMPGSLSTAQANLYIVNTDSRSTVTVDTSSYISS